MKQVKLLSTSLLVAMMLAVVIVTLGIAFVLFSAEERTPVLYLSLIMLLVAEAAMFGWPISNSLGSRDSRSPSFVLGLGLQSVFIIYLLGVIFLGLLGQYGAIEYELTTKLMFGQDIKLVSATATGNGLYRSESYDGLRNSQLVSHRSIDAGAQDDYIIKAIATVPTGISTTQADCLLESGESGTGFMLSLIAVKEDDSIVVKNCVPVIAGIPAFIRPAIEPRLGALGITLTVDGGPRPVVGTQGSYEVIYRVEIRNLYSFGSFKTLGIFHATLALLLVIVLLTWRMGSQYVDKIDDTRRATSQSYEKFRSALRVFHDKTVIDDQTGLKEFVEKLGQTAEDARYFSSDTPYGLENFDNRLEKALIAMQGVYGEYVNGAGDARLASNDLTTRLSEIAALLKQRGDACRDAR